MNWEIEYFRDDVQQAILDWPPEMQARYVHLTQRMIAFGPNLGMPHTRPLGKGMFEIRIKAKGGIARVFFCIRPPRRILMLHSFVKKSAKTPRNELKLARQRLKEIDGNA